MVVLGKPLSFKAIVQAPNIVGVKLPNVIIYIATMKTCLILRIMIVTVGFDWITLCMGLLSYGTIPLVG